MYLIAKGVKQAEAKGDQRRPPLGLSRQQRPANEQTEDDVLAQLTQPAEQIVGEEDERR